MQQKSDRTWQEEGESDSKLQTSDGQQSELSVSSIHLILCLPEFQLNPSRAGNSGWNSKYLSLFTQQNSFLWTEYENEEYGSSRFPCDSSYRIAFMLSYAALVKHVWESIHAFLWLSVPTFCTGRVPANVSGDLRRAAKDLHSARGGRFRQGDSGQPADHRPSRLPPGGRQTAVHRQDCGKPALR